MHRLEPVADGPGQINGIDAGLFGNGQCHSRIEFALLTHPHIGGRDIRAILHLSNIGKIDRMTVLCADYQLTHFLRRLQKGTDLQADLAIILGQ